jgi:nucleoside-diphosphate-sugar epimerase
VKDLPVVAERPRARNGVMKLAVFGANGPTGRLLTELALDEEHHIVAFTRHPDAFPIEHRRLEVAAGDVHDTAAVASAIDGVDAVVSILGVAFAKSPVTVNSSGVINIMAGMHAGGVKRFVCVSSSAIGPRGGVPERRRHRRLLLVSGDFGSGDALEQGQR